MTPEATEQKLSSILESLVHHEEAIQDEINKVHPKSQLSAQNLYRYLFLRSYDLRKYHDTLSDLGLSSLRSAEGYVLSNLLNVVNNLRLILNKPKMDIPIDDVKIIGYKKSKKLLKKNTRDLFDKSSKKHATAIMVTLPNEAASNPKIISKMVRSGMQIARINLSHGNLDIWRQMIHNIREEEAKTEKRIQIYMDLSGPKIRTSTIEVYGKNRKPKKGIPIQVGEHILLTKRETLGKPSKFNKANEQLEKAEVGVMLHEIIDDAQIGDVILFDDGMIKSKVVEKGIDDLELEITACYKTKLSSHKGINLPKTELHLPALTPKDIKYLPFVCEHADIIGYSFVRSGKDVEVLYNELKKNNAENIGVVFKIENQEAFENLPEILITGMRRKRIGVMIARGDLAVEIGFERISEVQNQILWLCEAAHIPVIWATQVLENLAKTGIPTRAEISDAALGAQAECIMLNKGPHIYEAIKVLRNVLDRMAGHTFKKKNELRKLNVTEKYVHQLQRNQNMSTKLFESS